MNKEQFKQWQENNKDFLLGKSFTNGISLYKIVNEGRIIADYDIDEELSNKLDEFIENYFGITGDKLAGLSYKAMAEMIDIAYLDELVSEWLGENDA